MPCGDSPGFERQVSKYSWTWNFEVSTIHEGHKCVKDKDKDDAKTKGAKLTFGEVLDPGVLLMLDNLQSEKKKTFHDLGMGPGKMLIQTYLAYPNLTKCVGVELAIGRYDLAESNVQKLVRYGWHDRKFLVVEYKETEFMTIVETTHKSRGNHAKKWGIGDRCVAFTPNLRRKKNEIFNYEAVIVGVSKKTKKGDPRGGIGHGKKFPTNSNSDFSNSNSNARNYGSINSSSAEPMDVCTDEEVPNNSGCDDGYFYVYDVEYVNICNKENEKIRIQNLSEEYLFHPKDVRTLEIWFGSLFDYPNSFNADICVLETDFPSCMHEHLVYCMSHYSPVGCVFLTYHDLKKFACFDFAHLRQMDVNVYDNDRYITSWSQGWRFYLWEHIPKHMPYHSLLDSKHDLSIGTSIVYFDAKADEYKYGEIFEISADRESILVYESVIPEPCHSKHERNEDDEACSDEDQSETDVQSSRDSKKYLPSIRKTKLKLNKLKNHLYVSYHKHKLNAQVTCYFNDNFTLMNAKIVGIYGDSMSYVVQLLPHSSQLSNHKGGEIMIPQSSKASLLYEIPEAYVFCTPHMLFRVGDPVYACWPRNAQNKNCPIRYKKYPAVVIGLNTDGTYQLQYHITPECVADTHTNGSSSSSSSSSSGPTSSRGSSSHSRHSSKASGSNVYGPKVGKPIAKYVREMWVQKRQ